MTARANRNLWDVARGLGPGARVRPCIAQASAIGDPSLCPLVLCFHAEVAWREPLDGRHGPLSLSFTAAHESCHRAHMPMHWKSQLWCRTTGTQPLPGLSATRTSTSSRQPWFGSARSRPRSSPLPRCRAQKAQRRRVLGALATIAASIGQTRRDAQGFVRSRHESTRRCVT